MTGRYSIESLRDRLRDRARLSTFYRFVARRVLDDNLFQAAGALSYTTVFALVPLSMVVFGVLAAFPGFADWSDRLSDYIFSNFVPTSARSVEGVLKQFSANADKLTAAGVIALLVSLLITLNGVETTFNRIWRVKAARPRLGRFLVYWTVLTLGALIAAASLAVSARFFAMAVFETQVGDMLESTVLRLTPMVLEWLAFAAIYRVVPHRTVKWRHALVGALLATVLFELVKWALGMYLGTFGNYSRIYGGLAFVPIFLLWVFLSWVAVLLGASMASAMSAFRYQPINMRLPLGYEMYGLLRLLARFREARRTGQGLHTDRIQQMEPILTDALVQDMLAQLEEIDVVRRAEDGQWLLSRDLDELTMAELYEACQLRVPVAEAHLPCRDDPLGRAAIEALDELRIPLRALLKRRVGTIHANEGE
ncbi:YihY family inner membrane protein [Lysobacter sp. A3-1-A15]|uniref:YihY family inner membrane protein n=1 Tax=Novilysobacter viscosus TaxID=3098602 RepID=UPI002ED95113